jgi:hypothetical protein
MQSYHSVMAKPTYDYAREKLWQAIHGLVSYGSIQERLSSAAMILTRLHRPDEDLPEELREDFKAVMHALTKEEAVGNEGTINATTRKLTAEQGGELAEKILSIYINLRGGI